MNSPQVIISSFRDGYCSFVSVPLEVLLSSKVTLLMSKMLSHTTLTQ